MGQADAKREMTRQERLLASPKESAPSPRLSRAKSQDPGGNRPTKWLLRALPQEDPILSIRRSFEREQYATYER